MIAEKVITENRQPGNYQRLGLLGKGRLAEVWLARQLNLGFAVALKIIPDKHGNKLITQFEKEVEWLARLEHPNILTPVDYGHTGDYLYLAMPLAPGGSLESRLNNRRFSRDEAFQLFDQLLDGLTFAHSNGIIHRDLKPSNLLFLTRDNNRLVITDFCLANTLSLNEDISLTLTGTLTGSPEYMAPEQFLGQTGQASDQYSAGVILFELLTGQKLYRGNTAWELGMRHTNDPLPFPHSQVPESLEPFFATALNKSPERRFKNIQEMRTAFYRAVSRLSAGKPAADLPISGASQQDNASLCLAATGQPSSNGFTLPAARPVKTGRNRNLTRNFVICLMVLLIGLLCLVLITQPQVFLWLRA